MADISLDDLLKAKAQELNLTPAPEGINLKKEVETATQKTELLSPEERKKVAEIKNNINLMDTSSTLQFGTGAQKNMAEFSDTILSQVRTKDSGYVGELLGELSTNINEFSDHETGSFLKKIPVLGSLIGKGETMMSAYEKLSVKVDRIQAELEKSKMTLLKDIVMFDALYEKNLNYFKSLQLYIQAGEEKLAEMKETTLPKLKQQAATSADPMAGQVVADFENMVERFEKKVYDLKISKTIAIQTAPQLRLIQNNDKILVERVQSAIFNAIPLWKNQVIIALGLSRQQKVLQMQRSINDTTNELLKRNAEMLKVNTIETAKENERSIVDIETVRKVNDDLIATIEETMKIHKEGREKRAAAEQELLQIEDRLKKTLMDNMDFPMHK